MFILFCFLVSSFALATLIVALISNTADISQVWCFHLHVLASHMNQMINRFNTLGGIEILIAFSHIIFLWNCFVALCQWLDSTELMSVLKLVHAVLCHEIIIVSHSLIHTYCQLRVIKFIRIWILLSVVSFAQIYTLVNFLLLFWSDCSVLSLILSWNWVLCTLSWALDSGLRWWTLRNASCWWDLLSVHACWTIVPWFGSAFLVCISLTNLFLKMLHALLSKNVSSIVWTASNSIWCSIITRFLRQRHKKWIISILILDWRNLFILFLIFMTWPILLASISRLIGWRKSVFACTMEIILFFSCLRTNTCCVNCIVVMTTC